MLPQLTSRPRPLSPPGHPSLPRTDAKIMWHPQGDYLAVKVDRFTKTKKSIFTGFELFSIRDKDIPMEVLELPNKGDKIVTFAWEPKGHRFAIVHGDGPRPNISFYSMRDDKGRLAVTHKGAWSGHEWAGA